MCKDCHHFKTFRDVYDDPLEDDDFGFCYAVSNDPQVVGAAEECQCPWIWSDK